MADNKVKQIPLDDLHKFINHVRAEQKWDSVYVGSAPETYMVSMAQLAITALQESREREKRLLEAINWVCGCGDSDFARPNEIPNAFWWRKELTKRAGLTYNGERYALAQATGTEEGTR